jgi:AraC-like DNA-binding protein
MGMHAEPAVSSCTKHVAPPRTCFGIPRGAQHLPLQKARHVKAFSPAKRDWERVAKEAGFRPAEMALLCSISERQLQRIFQKRFHCTPRRWLRELQCRLAKELLAQGYSTKAAAAELHFATDAHFCREFKKAFGASPQAFGPNQLSLFSENGLAALRHTEEYCS